jgi:hypothetical protein
LVFTQLILATWEAEIGKNSIWGQPRQIVPETPISKITRAKWTRGVAQVAEDLLSKCEVLSSNPSPKKKKKKNFLFPYFFVCFFFFFFFFALSNCLETQYLLPHIRGNIRSLIIMHGVNCILFFFFLAIFWLGTHVFAPRWPWIVILLDYRYVPPAQLVCKRQNIYTIWRKTRIYVLTLFVKMGSCYLFTWGALKLLSSWALPLECLRL